MKRLMLTNGTWVPVLGVLGVLLLVSCRERPEGGTAPGVLPSNAVAAVNGEIITEQELRDALGRRTGRSLTEEQKQGALENLIRREAIYVKAMAEGIHEEPEFKESVKRLLISRYREKKLGGDPQSMEVTDAEVQAYYDSHQDQFGQPERVRAALIYVWVPRTASPETRSNLLHRAETARTEAEAARAQSPSFGLLAQQYSEDQASRYRGGEIGWLTVGRPHGRWGEGLLGEIFKLKEPAEISPIITTEEGYYIAKLMDRQAATTRPLAEVKDAVTYYVRREASAAREEAFDRAVKEGLDIRINQEALDRIETAAPAEPRPPSLPGSR